MKEKLTYNTPNSAEIERHLSEVFFEIRWESFRKNMRFDRMMIVMLFLISWISFLEGNNIVFAVTFIIGGKELWNNIRQYRLYKKEEQEFKSLLEERIKEVEENSKDVFWEYTPEYFSFQNYALNIRVIWSGVSYNIFRDRYLGVWVSGSLFVLDKNNVADEVFDDTIKFLEAKSNKVE